MLGIGAVGRQLLYDLRSTTHENPGFCRGGGPPARTRSPPPTFPGSRESAQNQLNHEIVTDGHQMANSVTCAYLGETRRSR